MLITPMTLFPVKLHRPMPLSDIIHGPIPSFSPSVGTFEVNLGIATKPSVVARSFYTDGTYKRHNPNWHLEESPWKAHQVLLTLERNGLQPASICDIGCGAGEILKILSSRLPQTTSFVGYDISPQAIGLSSKRAGPNIEFRLGELPDPGTIYEMAVALDVVEHIEDYIGFLRKFKEIARYKLLHIPLDLAVQRIFRIRTLLNDMESVGHLHFFTKEIALAALKRAGYKIIDVNLIAKRIDLKMGRKRARLLTLPRRLLYSINPDLASRLFGGWSLSVLAE
jgi:SAM-dependent methyltransferase